MSVMAVYGSSILFRFVFSSTLMEARLSSSSFHQPKVIHIDPEDAEEMGFWETNNEKIALMAKNSFASDKVIALVCQNFTCSPSVDDPNKLEALLDK